MRALTILTHTCQSLGEDPEVFRIAHMAASGHHLVSQREFPTSRLTLKKPEMAGSMFRGISSLISISSAPGKSEWPRPEQDTETNWQRHAA
jgi:hypothetical protein